MIEFFRYVLYVAIVTAGACTITSAMFRMMDAVEHPKKRGSRA